MLPLRRTTPPRALALAGLLATSLLAAPAAGVLVAASPPAAGPGQAAQPNVSAANAAAVAALIRCENGTVATFPTCTRACQRCFDDHFQGCLAFCDVGCEDYCKTVLPRPSCVAQQRWVAQVDHIFASLDVRARMCQATGMNGCPDPPAPRMPDPTRAPFDPYHAVERNETGPASDELSVTARGNLSAREPAPGNLSAPQKGTLPTPAVGSARRLRAASAPVPPVRLPSPRPALKQHL
mmetsp:Transcript_31744/g.84033  ORF Transcript_31744/g.84033 Transcript_31744/m.84033 type:complete len:238 (-) Transcript_31744:58-771(-)